MSEVRSAVRNRQKPRSGGSSRSRTKTPRANDVTPLPLDKRPQTGTSTSVVGRECDLDGFSAARLRATNAPALRVAPCRRKLPSVSRELLSCGSQRTNRARLGRAGTPPASTLPRIQRRGSRSEVGLRACWRPRGRHLQLDAAGRTVCGNRRRGDAVRRRCAAGPGRVRPRARGAPDPAGRRLLPDAGAGGRAASRPAVRRCGCWSRPRRWARGRRLAGCCPLSTCRRCGRRRSGSSICRA
jgi:hypothetical protein